MMSPDPKQITEAVILWTGWQQGPWPVRDDTRVLDRFGPAVGKALLNIVKTIEEDFYSSNARHIAVDLPEMAEIAGKEFHSKHPDIGEEAVKALAWCYTYDYK